MPPLTLSPRAKTAVQALALAAYLLLIYYPALTNQFAFRDEYHHFFRYVTGHYRYPLNLAVEGRPLYWLLTHAFYPFLHDISDYVWLRGLNLAAMFAIGWLLRNLLIRLGWLELEAFYTAMLALTLPAFHILAGWGDAFQIPLGAIAGLLAAHAALSERRGLAVCYLIIAFCFYQLSAMIFFLPLLLLAIAPDERPYLPALKRFVLLFAAGLIPYLIAYKLWLHCCIDAEMFKEQFARAAFHFDPIGKAIWFLREPLWEALHLFSPYAGWWLPVLVIAVAAAGFALSYRKQDIFLRLVTLLACLPLSMLPLFTVAENNAEFRLQIVLDIFCAMLFMYGLIQIFRRYSGTPWRYYFLLAAAAMLAHYHFYRAFVMPQVQQVSAIQRQLAGLGPVSEVTYQETPEDPRRYYEYYSKQSRAEDLINTCYWFVNGKQDKIAVRQDSRGKIVIPR